MTGKYTFYVKTNNTGSLVETIHSFLITTNAPGLTFSSAITLYGIAELSAIGQLIIMPSPVSGQVITSASGYFSRIYALSGSWVGITTFLPYGDSNAS